MCGKKLVIGKKKEKKYIFQKQISYIQYSLFYNWQVSRQSFESKTADIQEMGVCWSEAFRDWGNCRKAVRTCGHYAWTRLLQASQKKPHKNMIWEHTSALPFSKCNLGNFNAWLSLFWPLRIWLTSLNWVLVQALFLFCFYWFNNALYRSLWIDTPVDVYIRRLSLVQKCLPFRQFYQIYQYKLPVWHPLK